MKPLITLFSIRLFFFCLKFTYLPYHSILRYPEITYFVQDDKHIFTPISEKKINITGYHT